MNADTSHALPVETPGVPRRADAPSGLQFGVARDLAQVTEAWELVYTAYRRINLIDPNPQHLHTVSQAVGRHAAVICGRIGGLAVSTLTAILDGPQGLPLDCVYKPEMDELRRQGFTLLEVGLFGDRREPWVRSTSSIFELMRYIYHFGVLHGASDAVVGVHPHHAPFYRRCFGFEPFAAERVHPTVKNHPVVPLRLNAASRLKLDPLPRGLGYFLDNPLPAQTFAERCPFEPVATARSRIGEFLRTRRGLSFPSDIGPCDPPPAA
jgi:hypothetical protein